MRLFRPSNRGAVLLAVVAGGACGCTEPFVPRATTVAIAPSTVSFNAVGATQPLTATVRDQRGDSMSGVTVSWLSRDLGVASVTSSAPRTATLSAVGNGTTQIVATADRASAEIAVTISQVAAQFLRVDGNLQVDTVGQELPNALVVQANDARGAPMRDVIVNFAVLQGGGGVSAASDTTGANGQAQVRWTIGTVAGAAQVVRAAIATGSVLLADFTATARAGAPATLIRQAGDSQRAAVGAAVSIAPEVRVRDAFDNPTPDVVVTFEATMGGGSPSKPSDTTDVDGIASVGWTLGGSAGENNLVATVSQAALTHTFVATALVPGPPASVVVSAGDNQTGLAGYALNVPPAVLVRDSASLPLANVQVDFSPSAGSGVTGSPAFTDGDGVATVGSWSVVAGPNSLTATVTGSGVTGNPLSFTATGASQAYDIAVRYLSGTPSAAQQAAFDTAEAVWQRLIFGDEPDVTLNFPAGTCLPNAPPINETVDDLVIWVVLDSIDGPGKVLGMAGPCIIRIPGALPLWGVMRFDTADVANLINVGRFDEVIVHEMGHVLGYGTIWNCENFCQGLLVGRASQGGTDPHFIGATATAAFDRNGGASYSAGAKIPVENCLGLPSGVSCGAGTYDSHWRESVFDTELMTGYIEGGVGAVNPLSVITTASMGDLGHTVNYAASEPYTVVNAAALRARQAQGPAIELRDDILRLPIIVVDAVGRVLRVIRPQ